MRQTADVHRISGVKVVLNRGEEGKYKAGFDVEIVLLYVSLSVLSLPWIFTFPFEQRSGRPLIETSQGKRKCRLLRSMRHGKILHKVFSAKGNGLD